MLWPHFESEAARRPGFKWLAQLWPHYSTSSFALPGVLACVMYLLYTIACMPIGLRQPNILIILFSITTILQQ